VYDLVFISTAYSYRIHVYVLLGVLFFLVSSFVGGGRVKGGPRAGGGLCFYFPPCRLQVLIIKSSVICTVCMIMVVDG